jgi:Recombination endonuclease VII
MRATGWTCRRVSKSVVCGHRNAPRAKKCELCGKPRPARRRPAHMAVLAQMDYAAFLVLNGGETCGICGRSPTSRRRLDRDHSHDGDGYARGLLCAWCNRQLPRRATPEWLRAAADYLDRAQQRTATGESRT